MHRSTVTTIPIAAVGPT